jgi:hypothetical protein
VRIQSRRSEEKARTAKKWAYKGAHTVHSGVSAKKAPAAQRIKPRQAVLSVSMKPTKPDKPTGGNEGEEDGLKEIEVGKLKPSGKVPTDTDQTDDTQEVDQIQ